MHIDDVRHVGVGIALTAWDVTDIADDVVAGDITETRDKAQEDKAAEASGTHFATMEIFLLPTRMSWRILRS